MKKCVVMFALLMATITIAIFSDDEEKEISEQDMLLEHNIQSTDLAHQNDMEMEGIDGVSTPYVYLEEDQ